MQMWTLRKGIRFTDHDGNLWTLARLTVTGNLLFENEVGATTPLTRVDLIRRFTNHEWSVDPSSLVTVEPVPYIRTPVDFESYPEADKTRARYRYSVIEPLLGRTSVRNSDLEECRAACPAKDDGEPPSLRSVRRWLTAYQTSHDMRSLLDSHRLKYRRRATEACDIIDQAIQELRFPEKPAQPADFNEIAEAIRYRIAIANQTLPECSQLWVPSRATLYRRFAELDGTESDKRLLGRDEAANRARTALGGPNVRHIFERVEVDHGQLDIVLYDPIRGVPLGRPWLTVAIDYYSKMILGFYLSLEHPDIHAVLECFRHAVWPKDAWLARYPDITTRWPAHGLWSNAILDNALETHAGDTVKALSDNGTGPLFCGRKKPWFKGSVERFIRSFQAKCAHPMPGTTKSNPVQRAGYPSEKSACIDYATYVHIVTKWIVEEYHRRRHRKLNMSPLEFWDRHIDDRIVRFPGSLVELELLTARRETRVLHRYGIEFDKVTYNSAALQEQRNEWWRTLPSSRDGPIVDFRYYRHTVDYIDVHDPLSTTFIQVPAVHRAITEGIDRFEYDLIRQALGPDWSLTDLQRAVGERRSLVNNSLLKVKDRKRLAKRNAMTEAMPAAESIASKARKSPRLPEHVRQRRPVELVPDVVTA